MAACVPKLEPVTKARVLDPVPDAGSPQSGLKPQLTLKRNGVSPRVHTHPSDRNILTEEYREQQADRGSRRTDDCENKKDRVRGEVGLIKEPGGDESGATPLPHGTGRRHGLTLTPADGKLIPGCSSTAMTPVPVVATSCYRSAISCSRRAEFWLSPNGPKFL
ncbi:hypothetical protein EYF80_001717 [Liparis tanakae]|uniref:Uncharacterized protein n=1 Tax=Liparis tanakae TaxID=230148 RepID=A0A4Z2JD23_9TELE|nr:hypothetical protein EYF80_001717 [Liparis tanakae]